MSVNCNTRTLVDQVTCHLSTWSPVEQVISHMSHVDQVTSRVLTRPPNHLLNRSPSHMLNKSSGHLSPVNQVTCWPGDQVTTCWPGY